MVAIANWERGTNTVSSFLATEHGVPTRTKHHCRLSIARKDGSVLVVARAPVELTARLG